MKKLSSTSEHLIEQLELATEHHSEQLEVGGPVQWDEALRARVHSREVLKTHIRKLESQLAAVVINLKDHKPDNVVKMILRNATK